MKKYVVVMEEVVQSTVEVWASDEEEAEKEAKMWYDRENAVSTGLEAVEVNEIGEE